MGALFDPAARDRHEGRRGGKLQSARHVVTLRRVVSLGEPAPLSGCDCLLLRCKHLGSLLIPLLHSLGPLLQSSGLRPELPPAAAAQPERPMQLAVELPAAAAQLPEPG